MRQQKKTVVKEGIRVAAITHSKLRNEMGLVGIEAIPAERRVYPRLVRQWPLDDVNRIPDDVYRLYNAFHWNPTYLDQLSGEYLIAGLRRLEIPTQVITTQKNLKDPKMLRKVKVMDLIEMTELLRKLKMNGQIRFPTKPSANMQILEHEIPFFSKHTTEAGSVDYYAPGEEPDDLVRALMICCFAVRQYIGEGSGGGQAVAGNLSAGIRRTGGIIADIEMQDAVFGALPDEFLKDL